MHVSRVRMKMSAEGLQCTRRPAIRAAETWIISPAANNGLFNHRPVWNDRVLLREIAACGLMLSPQKQSVACKRKRSLGQSLRAINKMKSYNIAAIPTRWLGISQKSEPASVTGTRCVMTKTLTGSAAKRKTKFNRSSTFTRMAEIRSQYPYRNCRPLPIRSAQQRGHEHVD